MISIDASVAFKWIKSKDEPYHQEAVSLLQRHMSGLDRIIVPHLLFIEIANSLVTKTGTTNKTIQDDLDLLGKFDLQVIVPDLKDIKETAKLAKKYKTTVYDMLYAVIAKRHKSILITADDNFRTKTHFSFVKLISEV